MNTKTKARKRVLFVLPSLAAGGAERVLITLMNGLDRENFEPVFLTVSDKGPMRDFIDPDIPFYSLNVKMGLLALPRLFLRLKAIKPDVVISTMAHLNFCILILSPLFPKTRFIVREAVTPSYFFDKYPGRAPIIRTAYRWLYSMADAVVSPAQKIIDEFHELVGLTSAHHVLLRNPVNERVILKDSAKPLEHEKNRSSTVHFVASGRLNYQKGFDRLIGKMASFKGNQDWRLQILGEGEERAHLEALIERHNLKDKIILRGHQENPWPYYAAADCFLLPSRSEGLPNVALEALACGTPVIATRASGGIEEIAALAPQKAVTIVDDMDEFLEAMREIKTKPSNKARLSLLPEVFSWQNVIEKLETMIMDLYK